MGTYTNRLRTDTYKQHQKQTTNENHIDKHINRRQTEEKHLNKHKEPQKQKPNEKYFGKHINRRQTKLIHIQKPNRQKSLGGPQNRHQTN